MQRKCCCCIAAALDSPPAASHRRLRSYLEDILQLKVLLVQRFHGENVSQRNITRRLLALGLGVAQRVRRQSEVPWLEAALPEESIPSLRTFRH